MKKVYKKFNTYSLDFNLPNSQTPLTISPLSFVKKPLPFANISLFSSVSYT